MFLFHALIYVFFIFYATDNFSFSVFVQPVLNLSTSDMINSQVTNAVGSGGPGCHLQI